MYNPNQHIHVTRRRKPNGTNLAQWRSAASSGGPTGPDSGHREGEAGGAQGSPSPDWRKQSGGLRALGDHILTLLVGFTVLCRRSGRVVR